MTNSPDPAATVRELTIRAIPSLRASIVNRTKLWPEDYSAPWCHRDVLMELMRGYEEKESLLAKLAAAEGERDEAVAKSAKLDLIASDAVHGNERLACRLMQAMDNGADDSRWPPGVSVEEALIAERDALRSHAQAADKLLGEALPFIRFDKTCACTGCESLRRVHDSISAHLAASRGRG